MKTADFIEGTHINYGRHPASKHMKCPVYFICSRDQGYKVGITQYRSEDDSYTFNSDSDERTVTNNMLREIVELNDKLTELFKNSQPMP